MTTPNASHTCPTCGGRHAPGTPHRPPTVSQRPPERPAAEAGAADLSPDDPVPAADSSEDTPGVSLRRREDDPEEEEEDTPQVSLKSGARSGNSPQVGVKRTSGSRDSDGQVGVRNQSAIGQVGVERTGDGRDANGQVSARNQGASGGPASQVSVKPPASGPGGGPSPSPVQTGGNLPPPPPEGSPAHVWEQYMLTLPDSHRQRPQLQRFVHSQYNQELLAVPEAERRSAAEELARTDQDRAFARLTGFLPTLDDELDRQLQQDAWAQLAADFAEDLRAEVEGRMERHAREALELSKISYDPDYDPESSEPEYVKRVSFGPDGEVISETREEVQKRTREQAMKEIGEGR